MPLHGFDDLHRLADARSAPVRVAAAGGDDPSVLRALREACDRGWVTPAVFGDASAIRSVAESAGVDLGGFEILDAAGEGIGLASVAEVRSGRAGILMKGRISTPTLMRAVLDPESGLRVGRVVCQVVLMEIAATMRRFLLTDTGIAVAPKLNSKVDILRAAVEVAHALGDPSPRVAIMAATEVANASMPETIDAAELQRRSEAGEFPGCVVQGPLSFDLAYADSAVDAKHVSGPVAGGADAMIFPNLVSANLTVKAIMYTAPCRFGGVLRGTTHPVAFMSRADTPATRLNSLSLALALVPA